MSNLAAQIAATAYLGETRTFTWTHQVSETDTTPVNITGWTLTVTLKNVALTTVTIAGTVTLGTAGTYSWILTAANTVTLGVGDCKIDVWRTNAGSETLMAIGTFSIATEVRV
jgi:hypothetical protein